MRKLVEKSYNIYSQFTESDGFFIERCIEEETDSEFKEALEDLDKFMFGL